MGSPVSPSLSDPTTCLMYSTYLFTVRADRDFDFFILSTTGLTVMLLRLPNGMSPMAGSIHLWRAALILAASLMGSRSRVMILYFTFLATSGIPEHEPLSVTINDLPPWWVRPTHALDLEMANSC